MNAPSEPDFDAALIRSLAPEGTKWQHVYLAAIDGFMRYGEVSAALDDECVCFTCRLIFDGSRYGTRWERTTQITYTAHGCPKCGMDTLS